jgi:hypothetical protein
MNCIACIEVFDVCPCDEFDGLCPYWDDDFEEKLIEKLRLCQT